MKKLLFVTLLAAAGSAVARPAPRAALQSRIDAGIEIIGIVHYSVNTYTDREWGYGNEKESCFNPTDFSAEQIVGACRAGGLQGLVIVAKHHDGFCLWPTKTTDHNISKSPFRGGKGDYVKEMELACRAQGLRFGVYCSPWDRNNAGYGTEAYVKAFHEQVRELNDGRYGEIFEMWFDGANGGDGWYGGANERRKISGDYYRFPEIYRMIRALQPNLCIFAGESDDSDLRWPGTEDGMLADSSRATIETVGGFTPGAGYGNPNYKNVINTGTPEGAYFRLGEADFPLRRGWFYHAGEKQTVRSPAYLMKIYLSSVGNGGIMNIGIAPDQRGRVADEDVAALRGFTEIREKFFAHRVKDPSEGFNVIVMKEDVRGGERVDGWSFLLDGVEVAAGTAIGVKRIRVLGTPMIGRTAELKITSAAGAAKVSYELYRVDPALVREVKAATHSEAGEYAFENKGIPTAKTAKSQVWMYKAPRTFSTLTLVPDAASVGGTPVNFTLAFSDDGETWREDPADHRLDNVAANPVPQAVKLGRTVTARYVRLTARRLVDETALLADLGLIAEPIAE